VIELLEMIFDVPPDRRRDLNVTTRVFKLHQLTSSNW
jgi:hypothetical protein